MSPDLILGGTAVGALLVFVPPARAAAWNVVRNIAGLPLAAVAEVVERRRHRSASSAPSGPPLQDPMPPLSPAGHTWQVILYVSHAGRTARLTAGVVTGPWPTAGEMEEEAMARWVATHGYPRVGKLCAKARAVPAQASRVEVRRAAA